MLTVLVGQETPVSVVWCAEERGGGKNTRGVVVKTPVMASYWSGPLVTRSFIPASDYLHRRNVVSVACITVSALALPFPLTDCGIGIYVVSLRCYTRGFVHVGWTMFRYINSCSCHPPHPPQPTQSLYACVCAVLRELLPEAFVSCHNSFMQQYFTVMISVFVNVVCVETPGGGCFVAQLRRRRRQRRNGSKHSDKTKTKTNFTRPR